MAFTWLDQGISQETQKEKKNPIASRFQRSVARLPFACRKWQITGSRLSFSQPERVSHNFKGILSAYVTSWVRRGPNSAQSENHAGATNRLTFTRPKPHFQAKQVMMYTNPVLPTAQACCCVSVASFCHLAVRQRKTGVGCGIHCPGFFARSLLLPPP